ncbi:MAG: nucleoside triphosphate pyrophosphohydrolase [Spirochaetia bacterium]|nr:nucleoside triphosphate pyrophosphohydrolase [Spirochaetia bacterium]
MNTIKTDLAHLAGASHETILASAEKAKEAFERLYTIVARLRAEDGCPWDREQTPASIRNNIIEEAYELVEAISDRDPPHVREEVGDLFMLASMVSWMYEQNSDFSASEALEEVSQKLIRRHPHVFGESDADTPDKVVEQWNLIKEKVEGKRKKDSILDDVPRHLPPMERAYKLQKKAAKVGFDWQKAHGEAENPPDGLWEKIQEEIQETREALKTDSEEQVEEEIGDLLFSLVNLARHHGVEPSLALQKANEKFARRFIHVEKAMKKAQLPMDAEHLQQMDLYWEEAKSQEQLTRKSENQ